MTTLDYASSPPPRPFNALPLKIAALCTAYILLLLPLTKLNFNPWRPIPVWLDYASLIGFPVTLICIYCSLRTLIAALVHKPQSHFGPILTLSLLFLMGTPYLMIAVAAAGSPPTHHRSLQTYMASRARGIGTAAFIYTTTNHGHFPPHLAVLILESQFPPEYLDNPADPNPYLPPTPLPPSAAWPTIAADVDSHSSFIYTGADLTDVVSSSSPDKIIILYSRPSPYILNDRIFLFADGHVEFVNNTDLRSTFTTSNTARAKLHLPPLHPRWPTSHATNPMNNLTNKPLLPFVP